MNIHTRIHMGVFTDGGLLIQKCSPCFQRRGVLMTMKFLDWRIDVRITFNKERSR